MSSFVYACLTVAVIAACLILGAVHFALLALRRWRQRRVREDMRVHRGACATTDRDWRIKQLDYINKVARQG